MWKKVYIANGSSSYETALLDTGAGVSLIDNTLAQSLGLRFTGRYIRLRGISGEPFYAFEAEATIGIPEAGIWSREFVYVPEISVQADGRIIVGRDYMRTTRLRLEYGEQELVSAQGVPLQPTTAGPVGIVAGTIFVGLIIVGLISLFAGGSKG